MNRKRIPAITALAALLVALVGVPGLAVADGQSPVDAMLEDDEDTSTIESVSDRAKALGTAVVSHAQAIKYDVDSMLAGEEATPAGDQAQLVRDEFNANSSEWVSWYNQQDYPADADWQVIALTYEGEDSSETDYLVLNYDSSADEYTSAEIVDEYDGETDLEQSVSGPFVHSYDDTAEAHELVSEVYDGYVTTGEDVTADDSYLRDLATDYLGHTEGDLV
ncbi:hypothetical protein [Halopenitus persicus]|uniref:hypothetical protein n=1 Tax=Halopenitus persicus TaxID=1048396 RepID=UPI0012FDB1FA|nr:hypothetical protein [Halopenitus persicus]